MHNNDRNIYQTARRAAGYTQERAAEMLALSVESIRAYETGVRIPPDDVVVQMVEVYGTQFLAYQHLRAGRIGSVIPDVKPNSLPQAVITLICRTRDFAAKHRTDTLMDISADGVIDSTERVEFNAIVSELDSIVEAAIELKFAREVEPCQR